MIISLVVPAFNEEKLIAGSLNAMQLAMAAFARRGWETERVVCDNNSTDRTAEVARECGTRIVFEPVNQISRARNRGAQAAKGDWLIFVDADSYPSVELMEDVARAIESGRFLGGGSTVKLECPKMSTRVTNVIWNGLSRTMKWAAGSFVFCEAMAFRTLGGFSEELYASEELDFSRRLRVHARGQGKSITILHRHPLATSARRMTLTTRFQLLRMFGETVWHRGANLRRRETCDIWYDGKR